MRKTAPALLLATAVTAAGIAAGITATPSPAEASLPTCFGRTVTIMGTGGNDVLQGTDTVSDVIYGGGGDDSIRGAEDYYDSGEATDFLCGGPGRDGVYGSPGNDKLNGGDGADWVDGYLGADVVQGNAGNDRMGRGSISDDDGEIDILRGAGGSDYIIANSGADRVYGQAGADDLVDTECDGGVMAGGGGNDSITSWYSSLEGGYDCAYLGGTPDRVTGGLGTDTALVDRLDVVTGVESVSVMIDEDGGYGD